VTLDEAAKHAEELANAGDERALAQLRSEWDDELEAAARHSDYRVRGVAYRALAQFKFRAKLELLRRGLDDESPVVRGSAIMSLESLSRGHPGDVAKFRPLLHDLASNDPNAAVRRLAIVCFRNGPPDPATISILDSIAADDEGDAEVRKTARTVSLLLVKKRNTKAK
jgi:HEAT repeat protein